MLSQNSFKTNIDDDFLKKLKDNDQLAFKFFYDLTKVRIYSTIVRMVINSGEADDIMQNVYIKIFNSIGNFKGDSDIMSWVYRIAVNSCLDHIRKSKKYISHEDITEVKNEFTDNSNRINDKIDGKIIEIEISKLPLKSKATFILHEIEGLKHEEISKVLDISVGTSKSQLFNAKKILRSKLSQYKNELINEL